MANISGTPFRDFIHRAGDGANGLVFDTEFATATIGADTIDSGAGNDRVFADDGDDTITAGTGDDFVDAGAGKDTVTTGDGNDIVIGGQGADNLSGGVGMDSFQIVALSEINGLFETINGGADVDTLSFSAFPNTGLVDISKATIIDVENLDLTNTVIDVTLTPTQLGAFTQVSGVFGVQRLLLSAPGVTDLTGAVLIGIDEIRGTSGIDNINTTGVAEGQFLNGLAGTDTLIGGEGGDTLDGGADNDNLNGNGGNDTLIGRDGTDTLVGGNGNDTLRGGGGLDTMNGGVGNDTFQIELVSDVSGLAEKFIGGDDFDTLDFATLNAAGTVNIAAASLTSIEALDLGSTAIEVTLTAAQLGAFEQVIGGYGVQRIILSGPGTADLTGATITGIDEIRGSSGADGINLTGVTEAQTVNGLAGNDTLRGGTAGDALSGGDDVDTILGNDGNDTIRGGQGADSLNGGVGYDSFQIQQVSDISGLAEIVNGGSDVDTLDFSTFNAFGSVDLSAATISAVEVLNISNVAIDVTMTPGQMTAFDSFIGSFGVQRLIMSAAGTANFTDATLNGIDEIRGSSGNDTVILTNVTEGQFVTGQLGNDVVTAGNGNDILDGGEGIDTLNGGNGNDRLIGGLGFDTMNGGAGIDTFVFTDVTESPAGAAADKITGFVHGQDIIDLAVMDANSEVSGDQAFIFIGASAFGNIAGQLRYAAGVLLGDINGDGTADFQINLTGSPVVTAADLIL